MAVVVEISGDHTVRFVAHVDDWSGREKAGTIAEVDEHNMALLVLYLASSDRVCHVQFSILIEISERYLAL